MLLICATPSTPQIEKQLRKKWWNRIIWWMGMGWKGWREWPSLSIPLALFLTFRIVLMFLVAVIIQSCLTLGNPMDCSMSGSPLLSFTISWSFQTHVHWISDAIQHLILCCPLLLLPSIFPSIRVSSNESALHIRWIEYWSFSIKSFQWIFKVDFPLGLTGLISLQSKWLSRVFSNTTVQKHQFSGTQPSLWGNSHIHMWLLEKP